MTEVANTEATEVEQTEAPAEVDTTPKVINADGTVNLELAKEELTDAKDAILVEVLNELVPDYNDVVKLVSDYRRATNIDGSVSEFVETTEDEEIVAMRDKIAQVKATLAKLTEAMNAKALDKMKADLASDFDEDKAKRTYQDKTVAIRESYNTYRDMFKLFKKVKFISAGEQVVDGKTVKKNSRYEALTPAGEAILAIGSFPRLTAGTSSVPNSDGKNARAWAMSTGWKTEDGKDVVSRGPLPSGLLEAWKEAGSPVVAE